MPAPGYAQCGKSNPYKSFSCTSNDGRNQRGRPTARLVHNEMNETVRPTRRTIGPFSDDTITMAAWHEFVRR